VTKNLNKRFKIYSWDVCNPRERERVFLVQHSPIREKPQNG